MAASDDIRRAVRLLQAGDLVAFPTETVYGLGCRAFDARAARKVYRAKGRPADNPLIVHIGRKDDLPHVARDIPPAARCLAARFWPGPLTMILPKTARVPKAVTGGLDTVAVRMPDHPVALRLIRALGEPIAAPSANRSGRPSPTTAAHVRKDLPSVFVLDAGACRKGVESTIVDMTGPRPRLLRPGALGRRAIERVTGPLARARRGAPAAPGARHRHYAPDCRVVLVCAAALSRLPPCPGGGVVALRAHPRGWAFTRRFHGLSAYARGLFAALRAAEDAGVKTLYCEKVSPHGMGEALMDRLNRASACGDER